MTRSAGLRAALAATLLGVTAGVAATSGSAPAAAAGGRCEAGSGVTVVVDFAELGGGTQIGCSPGSGDQKAADAVAAAGFVLTRVQGQPGFVCRIDGKPDQSRESCVRTPPPDAYWGLFWADGSSPAWKYATVGVDALEVPEGGSVGWRFEDGGAREDPGAPPTTTAQADPTPTPKPSTKPAPEPSPSPTRSSGPAAGSPATPSSAPASSALPSGSGAGAGAAAPGSARAKAERRPKQHRPEAGESPAERATGADATTSADGPTALASGGSSSTESAATGRDGVLTLAAAVSALALVGAAGVVGWRRRG